VWFSLHYFPISQVLHPFKKLLPAIVISSQMEETQSLYRLKSFKERLHFLCAGIVETERPRKTLWDIWKLIQTFVYARKFGYDRTSTPTARTPPYMYADVKYHIKSRTNTDTSLSDELTAVKRHPLTFSRAQMKDQSFGAICKPM